MSEPLHSCGKTPCPGCLWMIQRFTRFVIHNRDIWEAWKKSDPDKEFIATGQRATQAPGKGS